MNKVTLVGRLTKDPELKNNGTAVCKFILAVNRKYKKEGYPEADFIPIILWGKLAENVSKYKKKGDLIAISGRMETGNYEDKDGNRKYITQVIGEDIEFLGVNKMNQVNDQESDVTPIEGDIPF